MRKFEVTLLLLIYIEFFVHSVAALQEDCIDYFGFLVPHGHLYIPGPSVCSRCACYHGQALFCKAIYCDPPYFCKKFRIGEKCCEFDCLDSDEDIAKEKERLRKRKRFLGIVYGDSKAMKPQISTSVPVAVSLALILSTKLH